MKLSDINENISEAPDLKGGAKRLAGKIGKGAKKLGKKAGERAKLELQAQTPFRRTTQKVAKSKIQIRKQAASIKNDFKVWMASAESGDATPTAENFVNFITNEKPDLAPFVKDVGKAFGFITPMKKAVAGDFKGQPSTDKEKSSKEKTGGEKKRKLSPEEQAGFDKINKASEEEAAGFEKKEKRDITASKGDDKEPKVDTSASIYEDRLAAMLYERKLSDNDIDTYIVRLLQTKKKGSAEAVLAKATGQEQEQKQQKQEKPEKTKGKAQAQGPEVSDEDDDNFSVPNMYRKDLKNILKKVVKSDQFDKNETKDAEGILKYI